MDGLLTAYIATAIVAFLSLMAHFAANPKPLQAMFSFMTALLQLVLIPAYLVKPELGNVIVPIVFFCVFFFYGSMHLYELIEKRFAPAA